MCYMIALSPQHSYDFISSGETEIVPPFSFGLAKRYRSDEELVKVGAAQTVSMGVGEDVGAGSAHPKHKKCAFLEAAGAAPRKQPGGFSIPGQQRIRSADSSPRLSHQ